MTGPSSAPNGERPMARAVEDRDGAEGRDGGSRYDLPDRLADEVRVRRC